MTVHFDQDNGPDTELTEEHRYAIEESIRVIDFELGRSNPEHVRNLTRERQHLLAELAAGRTLVKEDEGDEE
jgi:hypothetical protein